MAIQRSLCYLSNMKTHVSNETGGAFARLAAILSIVLVALLPLIVIAAQGTCSVSPQQVPLGGTYTLSVSGLTPNTTYWVISLSPPIGVVIIRHSGLIPTRMAPPP